MTEHKEAGELEMADRLRSHIGEIAPACSIPIERWNEIAFDLYDMADRLAALAAPSPALSSSDTGPKKYTMDFFMGPDDEAGIQFEDFVIAVATWGWMRPGGQPTVREAADQFNVVDQVILNAVKRHPWMFLAGESDDDPTTLKIEYDGE